MEKVKKDDWRKVQSKSHPGRFYLFNCSTGETQWLSPGKAGKGDASSAADEEINRDAPPRILASKFIKTPAQDRLKRLQHELKADGLKKQTNKPARRSQLEMQSKKISDSREQQENMSSERPATSNNTKSNEKLLASHTKTPASLAKPSRRTNLSDNAVSKNEFKNKLDKVSLVKETKQTNVIPLFTPTRAKDDTILLAANDPTSTSHTSQNTTKTPSTGILSKLKDIFKLPFNSLKTQLSKSEIEKEATAKNSSSTKPPPAVLTALSELRAEQKKIEKQNILKKSLETTSSSNNIPSSSVVLEALNDLRTQQKRLENQRDDRKLLKTKSINPPSSVALEALTELSTQQKRLENQSNERKSLETTASTINPPSSSVVLEALTELRTQQKMLENQRNDGNSLGTYSSANASLCSTPTNATIPNYQRGSANSRLERLRQSLILKQTATLPATSTLPTSSFNISTNSLYQTANNTINDEIEAMDWQSTEKEDIIELSSSESTSSILLENKKVIRSKSAETMGEIYDTVGENLLRLSAEKKRDKDRNTAKWLKDFYYFVVDTNVLLEYLSFLEDLSRLKLCDTQGSVLYIPYAVLQELDKLKMRSGCQEGVKTLSVRAIKYLNKKFESKNLNLQAQTAIEERQHIIDVYSADDSIINCCLQAKAHVPNLVLLTEDVNLRNKAICNNIVVTTKSDLMCKRYGKTNEDSL